MKGVPVGLSVTEALTSTGSAATGKCAHHGVHGFVSSQTSEGTGSIRKPHIAVVPRLACLYIFAPMSFRMQTTFWTHDVC